MSASSGEIFEAVKAKLAENGQMHVLEMLPDLTAENPIIQKLHALDVKATLQNLDRALQTSTVSIPALPFHPVFDWAAAGDDEKRELEAIGRAAIREGTVAAVILSGGQGTRLGFDGPKGVYDIGLPSHKSIFQLHIERIRKVCQMCCKEDGSPASIPVYIMTSDLNHQIIVDYFAEQHYFNYPKADVFFFEQALELCLSTEKKIIVESPTSLALAPDGNGGLFTALQSTGALGDISNRGVQHLHAYGIDNVLTRSVDPAFIGLCIRDAADCGNKVVPRVNKDEKVGVTVLREGRMFVAEYSELPANIAGASDAEGNLIFNAANICNHYFNVKFLVETMLPNLGSMYHLAAKKIPYMNEDKQTVKPDVINGYKLELFIFDGFPLAERFTVMSVDREEEFAPVKNAIGATSDTPVTARAMMSRQAVRWLQQAGAIIQCSHSIGGDDFNEAINNGSITCEISPLVSYSGEGLEKYNGQVVMIPGSFLL